MLSGYPGSMSVWASCKTYTLLVFVARELQTLDGDSWLSMYLNSIAIVKSCFRKAQLASVLTDNNQPKQFNPVHGSSI